MGRRASRSDVFEAARASSNRKARATYSKRFKVSCPGKEEPSYQQVANALNLSVGALKTAIHRLRGRYGALLREEVARTVATPAEVDEELRYLRTMLGG